MCGFAGLLTSRPCDAGTLADRARRMAAPLAHRGPDDGGEWADAAAGVALGFRRLAIVELSPLGHQPMRSPSGRFVVAFNGEVYNYRGLRRELEPHGHRFRGHSDTEVIAAAFEQWGVREAVRRCVGMFAMAVWDAERRELSLVRDRLGKKPLFVYREPGLVTFGSELKALAEGPSFDRSIDPAALAAYLRYLYVPAPRSIFRRVIKLLPGHILTLTDARLPLPDSQPYWSLREAALAGIRDPLAVSDEEAVDRLDSLLADAVACRLHSDVPLGALLSGGIDSSTIVALMQQHSTRPVRTYTIGFAEGPYDETEPAAQVARHLGTDHTDLRLTGEDALTLVPRMAEIFDEPLADPSQLPTLLVSQLARRHVTVALCGDGGDELFGGYNRYVYGTRMLPRVDRMPRVLRQGLAAGLGSVPCSTWDRLGGVTAVLPGLSEQRFGARVHKLSTLMAAGSVGHMYRSLLSAWQQPGALLAAGEPRHDRTEQILDEDEPAHLLDRMMLSDQLTYLPDDLLAKVDRASMATSLEVRAPLLDHRVVELSWRLPRLLKLRGSTGKWILRQVLYRRVPKAIVDRPKMGFSVPIERWLRGPLRGWAEERLSPDAVGASGLDPAPVRAAWRDLQDGTRQSAPALWAVLMFQAWRERWGCASHT